ncbi:hypothetical protein L7F22_056536 [Adiantum nelumboides]|nr:hypothetical protein [Adiantum nelumboides]
MAMTDTRPGVPVPAPAPPRTYAPRAAVPIRTGIPRRIDIADVTPNNVASCASSTASSFLSGSASGGTRMCSRHRWPTCPSLVCLLCCPWLEIGAGERNGWKGADNVQRGHDNTALFNDIPVGNVCCRFERLENKDEAKLYIMTLGCLAPYRRIGIASKRQGQGRREGSASCVSEKGPSKKDEDKKKKGEERRIVAVYLHVQTDNDEAKVFLRKARLQGGRATRRILPPRHRAAERVGAGKEAVMMPPDPATIL